MSTHLSSQPITAQKMSQDTTKAVKMADQHERRSITDKPKKKQLNGRKRELSKDERFKNHVTGPPCNCYCSKLRCFEMTTEDDRNTVIRHFNYLKTKDEQDALLSSWCQCTQLSAAEVEKRIGNKQNFINVLLNII